MYQREETDPRRELESQEMAPELGHVNWLERDQQTSQGDRGVFIPLRLKEVLAIYMRARAKPSTGSQGHS